MAKARRPKRNGWGVYAVSGIFVLAMLFAFSYPAFALCELAWATEASSGFQHEYAGVFGQMFCNPTETCPGGEPWPLWAEIWTTYPDESCWFLEAQIGPYPDPNPEGAYAIVGALDGYTYPGYCWGFIQGYFCDGTSGGHAVGPGCVKCCGGESSFCDTGYYWDWIACDCLPSSPIIIDTAGNGFSLTDSAGGVNFDLNSDGVAERLSWTSTDSDDGFLVLDRDGNGSIDSGAEIFGNFTPQPESSDPNGFIALAVFDDPSIGGNGDGVIDELDAVFRKLRVWRDLNHNGMSESSELFELSGVGIKSLDLRYKESRRRDEHGNWFRYRARVRDSRGAHLGRWAWDVFLLTEQP